MSSDLTVGVSPFDGIRREDERGEYWSARDLMPVMEYGKWENFAAIVEKAKASLAIVQGREQAEHHFLVSGSDGGRWGNQRLDDYRLTRFAAYLVAMAGDDSKRAVAEARVYFAVKTREAEVARPAPQIPDMNTPEGQLQVAEMLAAGARRQIEQAAEIKRLTPKAEYVDAYVNGTEDASIMRVVAKQLRVTERWLRQLLRDKSILSRRIVGTRWSNSQQRTITEYEWSARAGYETWFVQRDQPDAPRLHNGQMRTTLYVTPIGKVKLAELVTREGEAS